MRDIVKLYLQIRISKSEIRNKFKILNGKNQKDFEFRASNFEFYKIMALYHTYRPQIFADVIGQDHIVSVLTNAIKNKNISHAYLFCGPRGLGKTTLARILAKTINCENPRSSEPCDQCSSCQQISSGSSIDVIEIDAASNRGIDEIRELREKARFSSSSANKKKVFIIDEVHMLTKEAFNALLKILEEPPNHVIFILATTEAHKVPATILSRVQRHDFKRPSVDTISKHLQKISGAEKIRIDENGARTIAKLADGSFRDAIMLLDQLQSIAANEVLSSENILKNLGLARLSLVHQFIELLEKNDTQKLFQIVEKLDQDGVDMTHFGKNLIEALSEKLKSTLDQKYLSWINIFLHAIEQIKYSPIAALPIEIAIYKISETSAISSEVLDMTSAEALNSAKSAGDDKVLDMPSAISAKVPKSDSAKSAESSESAMVLAIDSNIWQKIIAQVKIDNAPLSAILETSVLKSAKDDTLNVAVRFKFHKDKIDISKNRQLIENAIEKMTGKNWILNCEIDPEIVKVENSKKEEELAKIAEEIF
ncbi:MAG: DNA polymerase III subunit gamma/tau [Candidatus Berkelbacteria bacterium Licking1014_85]|uniref:DNA polymerase III subunit gamma/tau n=1 Tax=Candidatus Berkelbacteria bacterium Licking1014_85 TaxID=2017148 RepID=A0A554LLU1_9BACT|nr:MAG: DNA polymerase III subunit gamma/tau [Candidatus Berkelbacteria bacterium Licking1014_85]